MPGEQEVRPGRRYLKSQLFEFLPGPLAGFNDPAAVLHVVLVVLHARRPGGHGHAVNVVGVCGILDRVQVPDQLRIADAEAQPGARHGAGLGEGLGHQQVVVFPDQRHAAFRAEIHIGLVHHHHVVGILLQDLHNLFPRQGYGRRRVRVGDEDRAGSLIIIGDIDGQVFLQRDRFIRNPVDPPRTPDRTRR